MTTNALSWVVLPRLSPNFAYLEMNLFLSNKCTWKRVNDVYKDEKY